MNRKKALTTGLAVFVAVGCLALLVEGSPADGPTIAGEYEWLRTDAALDDPRQVVCDRDSPGDQCYELCRIINNTGVVPTGTFCCVNDADVGGWDDMTECALRVQ